MTQYIDVHGTVNFDTQNIVCIKTIFKNSVVLI